MNPSRIRLSVLAIMLLALLPWAACKGSGATLVKVGSKAITESDLESLARVNPRLKPRLSTPAGRQKVLESYVEQELLYRESLKRGLQRKSDVKDKIALYEKVLVAQALLDDELDRKVREYYEAHPDEFERVKVSHILVRSGAPEKPTGKADKNKKKPTLPSRSDQEALKIAEGLRDRILKGEDFAKVAKQSSDDEKTKTLGGELGYITLGDKRLERWGWLPLGEKAFTMKKGEVSEPIHTKDGFHLLLLSEEKTAQSYEEAEAGIKFRMQADIRMGLLEDLKKKYTVEYAKTEMAPEATLAATPVPAEGEGAAPSAPLATPETKAAAPQ